MAIHRAGDDHAGCIALGDEGVAAECADVRPQIGRERCRALVLALIVRRDVRRER